MNSRLFIQQRFVLAGFLLAALLALALQNLNATPRKVIVDDDGVGLMHLLLLGAEDIEIVGFTSVVGNSYPNRAAALVLRMQELVDATDAPVALGAVYPLMNTELETKRWEALYGKLTWKGVWMKEWVEDTIQDLPTYYEPNDPVDLEWGNPEIEPIQTHAVNFMIEQVHAHPGEITILAGGPMTNLALAQRLDPEFASLAKELVYMGGSFNPRQRIQNQVASEYAREFGNSPRREFNIRLDPEAASIVSRAPWKKITVIPVDPSTGTQFTPELLDRLITAAPEPMAEVMKTWQTGSPMWDVIAGAVWLEPELSLEAENLYVDYNTSFGPGYGDTLSWNEGYQPELGEQAATVIRSIDRTGLEALLVKSAQRLKSRD
ncbi:nucleoside hydrolase [Coraliomargarita parva]|uniref:nucleoside hydrolase n=1 Tax=Coraliomargarita parva TaxID=3014050 RepID=UPI0022B5A176|nr:nucleoside hydrolase [Coraliomargarita parva]